MKALSGVEHDLLEAFCLHIIDLLRGFSTELNENNVRWRSGETHRDTIQNTMP